MNPAQTTRRRFLTQAGMVSAAMTLGWPGIASAGSPLASVTKSGSAQRVMLPTCAELAETGERQRRDLSLPHSRIVVNPYDFNNATFPLPQSTGPELPLHLGYYAADQIFTLQSLASVYRRMDGEGSIDVVWQDDFDTLDPAWDVGEFFDTTLADGQLTVSLRRESPDWWGELRQWVDVDLDQTPYVQLRVTELADAWGLQVADETGQLLTLQGDWNDTGTFTYNISQLAGWTGQRRFQLVIRVAIWDRPATFDFIRILGTEEVLVATESGAHTWRPDRLDFEADFGDGITVTGTDSMSDVNSVLRSMSFAGDAATATVLALTGRYVGAPQWNQRDRTLTVTSEHFAYALCVSEQVDEVAYYPTVLEALSDSDRLSDPGEEGYWVLRLAAGAASKARPIELAVGFATTGDGGAAEAAKRSVLTLRRGGLTARHQQERFWNDLLSRLPHPLDFNLRGVATLGVTADDVRGTYYKGWVFCASNVLPPQPETGFNFPQLSVGKPSRWNVGADLARATAMWDSVLAIQLLGYIDPDTAWDTLTGFVSLAAEDGEIGGENLPSRVAQTALILYQITGDRGRLRRMYADMRRFLLWAKDHPIWITRNGGAAAGTKDAQFVVSALLDMEYAEQIAGILGDDAEAQFWRQTRDDYFQVYLGWFWDSPTSDPIAGFNEITGAKGAGDPLSICGGMHLAGWPEGSPHLDGLRRRFLAVYRPGPAFAGFGRTRYPDVDLTTYGLLDQAMLEQAVVLTNSALRSVVLSGMFAENYTGAAVPVGWGVRPAAFGMGLVLFAVLLNNGYRFDLGWPAVVRTTEEGGGVVGIPIQGKRLDVVVTAGSSTVALGGNLITGGNECAEIEVPLGQTVPLPAECATVQ